MAFSGLSRPGVDSNSGSPTDLDLFLKLFAGEVLEAFDTANVISPLGMERRITTGKSASFPVLGRATAKWHEAGTDMITEQNADYTGASGAQDYLNSIPHGEIEVFVDDPIVAPVLISKIDEMRNHYDVRAPYARELGRALAKSADRNALAALLTVAESSTANVVKAGLGVDVGPLGDRDLGSGAIAPINLGGGGAPGAYSVANFEAFCFDAQAEMDNKGVPEDDRWVIIRPEMFYALIESGSKAMQKEYSDGGGDYAAGTIYKIGGLRLVKSQTFGGLKANLSTQLDPGARDGAYGRNWTTIACIAGHNSAFATVKMADVSMEQQYILPRRAHFMVASYVMGHKGIRPEAAVTGRASSVTTVS